MADKRQAIEEMLIILYCQIENVEAIHVFLEEVREQYTALSFGNQSEQLRSANLKLTMLAEFLGRSVSDMNTTTGKAIRLNNADRCKNTEGDDRK